VNSIRTRLILGVFLTATLCLAASGVAIYLGVRDRMFEEQDRALAALAQSNVPAMLFLLGEGRRGGGRPFEDFLFDARPAPPRERRLAPLRDRRLAPLRDPMHSMDVLFQCWQVDGRSVDRSEGLGKAQLPQLAGGGESALADQISRDAMRFGSYVLLDGTPVRAVGLWCRAERRPEDPEGRDPRRRASEHPEVPPPVEFTFALEVSDLHASLRDLRWILVATWLVTSLACAGILAVVVHASLRPLSRLQREISELDEANLDRRFPIAGTPRELEPVVEQLNALLARIGHAFEREQAFSADTAHELRTPLSGLRSTLEVALARPRSSEEHREAAAQCLEITLQMQAMVESLLEMARGAGIGEETEGALAELIEECRATHAIRAEKRGLRFTASIDPSCRVHTDLRLLRRIFENIFENAVDYADPGGPDCGGEIAVEVARESGELVITVANPASGASADLPEHAFDAFWRGDSARTDTGRHAGLGLALSRRIAHLLGGTLTAELIDGRFRVSLRLPDQRGG
jgi:two-component system, OmpR family, heavy metal sensor histidine kinase CusS